jgi:hypothetical protein
MKHLILYLGTSETDVLVQHRLEAWSANTPEVTLDCVSIHSNPAQAVRLGITELPALVTDDEVIAQGMPENWITALLGRLFVRRDVDD